MKAIVKTIVIKYLLAALLVGALCVMVACGGGKETESEAEETQGVNNETESETEEVGEDTEITLPRDEF